MWYRTSKFEIEGIRTAKPWGWSAKPRRKKIKKYDFEESPMLENTAPISEPIVEPVNEPRMPANVTEFPDLPAGVKIPPAQHAPISKKPIEPENPHKKHPSTKPKELEDLYGPDTNIADDHIIDAPLHKPSIQEPHIEPLPMEESVEQELEEDAPEENIPDQSNQPVPNPPIHEFCHCEIITMPGGRRIWRANEGACNDCLKARDIFNQWQVSLFGS